jgi:glycosyltransferase involved in cell wall biosynthesis
VAVQEGQRGGDGGLAAEIGVTGTESPKRALVASDSAIARDPRVLNQIRWLTESGWVVDSLGRGTKAPELNGIHYPMRRRSVVTRVLSYLLLPSKALYQVLTASTIPKGLAAHGTVAPYDLVVLNEIELLPWFAESAEQIVKRAPHGTAHLDLHEFAPSQRSGLLFRLFFRRYRNWLISFIAAPSIRTRSVVSPGIAKLYSDLFPIPTPAVVRSCAEFVEQAPSVVDPDHIKLVHHGSASLARGPESLIEAMRLVQDRFTLHLMLVGSAADLKRLKQKAAPLGSRVVFKDPVAVQDVAKALNEFDLEVIFFPPVTENLRHALPNKLFQAIQGRLGVIIGESPDMAQLLSDYGNGIEIPGWTASDLAAGINALDVQTITRLKERSGSAALALNVDEEKNNFLAAAGLAL